MFDFLKGSKTYIVAILVFVVSIAHALGYIDDETKNTLLTLLAASGTATVAAKINRIDKQV